MAFIREASWSSEAASRSSGNHRFSRQPLEVTAGILATVVVQLLIFALLVLKLTDVRPVPNKDMDSPPGLSFDIQNMQIADVPVMLPPGKPSAPVERPPAAVVVVPATPEWSYVKIKTSTVPAPESDGDRAEAAEAGHPSGGGGTGGGAASGDPYASAGIAPGLDAVVGRRTVVPAPPPIASGAVMVDPASLRDALTRFHSTHPRVKGSASFIVRLPAGRASMSIIYTDGTLDSRSAALLEQMLRASLRVLGPRLAPAEITVGPLEIGSPAMQGLSRR